MWGPFASLVAPIFEFSAGVRTPNEVYFPLSVAHPQVTPYQAVFSFSSTGTFPRAPTVDDVESATLAAFFVCFFVHCGSTTGMSKSNFLEIALCWEFHSGKISFLLRSVQYGAASAGRKRNLRGDEMEFFLLVQSLFHGF